MLLVLSSRTPGNRRSTEYVQSWNLKPEPSTLGFLGAAGSIHMFLGPVQQVLFRIRGQ